MAKYRYEVRVHEHSLLQSIQGKPVWDLFINPSAGEISVRFDPTIAYTPEYRRAVDELVSTIAQHLHGLAQGTHQQLEG